MKNEYWYKNVFNVNKKFYLQTSKKKYIKKFLINMIKSLCTNTTKIENKFFYSLFKSFFDFLYFNQYFQKCCEQIKTHPLNWLNL